MRDPVERIVSHYSHRQIRNRVEHSPDLEVFRNPIYINRSRYSVQLRPYYELFPSENILLVIFEEFIGSPQAKLREVLSFLRVSGDTLAQLDYSAKNRSVGTEQPRKLTHVLQPIIPFIPPLMRRRLRHYFYKRLDRKTDFSSELKAQIRLFLEDDIRRIEQLMNRTITAWHRTN